MFGTVQVRDHVKAKDLDRVKLSIQKGPLGSFDRPDGERIALLWNLTKDMTAAEFHRLLLPSPIQRKIES